MMIIFGIVVSLFIFDLYSRVGSLEKIIKPGTSLDARKADSSVSESMRLYIQEQRRLGRSKETIVGSLISAGWNIVDIEKAYAETSASVDSSLSIKVGSRDVESSSGGLISWLKEDWLLKTGALLLLFGFGWLTTYAFLNNWVGPSGRITIGLFFGVFFMVVGYWRAQYRIHQGSIFLVLGSATILVTVFAARVMYGFFTPISGLILIFLSAAFVSFVGVIYKEKYLPFLGLVVAGSAPLFVRFLSYPAYYIELFAYLFVVVLGTLWVVAYTKHRELLTSSFVLVLLYSLPHLVNSTPLFSSDVRHTLILYAYAFTALFFIAHTVGLIRLKPEDDIVPDMVTAAGNGLFLLSWIMVAAEDDRKSFIMLVCAILFALGAFIVSRGGEKKGSVYVYAGVVIMLIGAATGIEFKGEALTIAYTLQSACAVLAAYFFSRDIKIAERVSMLFVLPCMLSLNSIMSPSWINGVFQKDFFALLILSITFLGLGVTLFFEPRKNRGSEVSLWSVFFIASSLYALVLIWLSLKSVFLNDSLGVMIALVIYTVIGLFSYFYGVFCGKKGLYFYGAILIAFVIGRLFLIDVWFMDMAGRIGTFFLIGALLVSTAFFGNRKV